MRSVGVYTASRKFCATLALALLALGSLSTAAADIDGSLAAAALQRTDIRIDVRQADGSEAILRRTLQPFEHRQFGIAAIDERSGNASAPPLPQPPEQGDYPPGAFRLEFIQVRGSWMRTSRFDRDGDGPWRLAGDELDNPPGKAALGRSLSGATRPVQ